jgi:predicted 3-demethylubiquinone-9 3-methyltransferase (glyoxalase superfamily)
VTWQVVPRVLPELVSGQDQPKINRVMQAMMGMSKIDIATLQQAANGGGRS